MIEKVKQPVYHEKGEDDGEEEGQDDTEDNHGGENGNHILKVHKVIIKAAIKGSQKGGKFKVTINIGWDFDMKVAARVSGIPSGVRCEINLRWYPCSSLLAGLYLNVKFEKKRLIAHLLLKQEFLVCFFSSLYSLFHKPY